MNPETHVQPTTDSEPIDVVSVREQPVVATAPEAKPLKQLPPQKHYLIVFFFSFMWGTFGVDRFYLGKVGTGLLKLISFGGFGLWTIIDLFVLMGGATRDRWDRPLLQQEEYRKFSHKVVTWFAVVIGVVVLIGGLLVIGGLYLVVSSFLDGSLQGVPGLPQLDVLRGQDPTDLQSLGL
ncbi:hypothetical protein CL689_01190 [Candidatus Saccharibacteria bacterium]|nr:hypothetical protein [Candidatus Saccharibacteria bacterium]MBJ58461.1 hypothetical protein [Candidatus Saccharibacteria bacterium]MBQ68665.1 hypothetical protein [Candidatus Saccharibacteria bacterium]|tara:strand:+ start:1606 stop:2142 length:537 start_codon:yes stop_codon:yes gene_type:complete